MRRALPALALCLAALAGPAAAAPLTLVLPHDALTVLPARVAAARGFFREEGAAVRLLSVGTGSKAAAALAGGGGAPSVSFDALVAGEFAAEEGSR